MTCHRFYLLLTSNTLLVQGRNALRSMNLLSILLLLWIDPRHCFPGGATNKSTSTTLAQPSSIRLNLSPSSATSQRANPLVGVVPFKPQLSVLLVSRLVHQHSKRDVLDSKQQQQATESTTEMAFEVRTCSYDVECHDLEWYKPLNETTVRCRQGKCQTIPANETDELEQQKKKKSDKDSASQKSLRMLPIMIVLGIMFVGMCVAMNMFSRARFKNNRGIFSNPRILKLASANQQSVKQKKSRRRKIFAEGRRHRAASQSASSNSNKVANSDSSIAAGGGETTDHSASSIHSIGPQTTISDEADLTAVVVSSATTEISSDK